LEDNNLKLKIKRYFLGFRNSFQVLYDDEPNFVWNYWSSYSNPLNLLDFPFSTMDEENYDFFAFLANNFNDKSYVKECAKSYTKMINTA